jgi:hypothetical protein
MYWMIMLMEFPVYRCFAYTCVSLWRIHYCNGVARSETLWNSSRGDNDPVARLARTARRDAEMSPDGSAGVAGERPRPRRDRSSRSALVSTHRVPLPSFMLRMPLCTLPRGHHVAPPSIKLSSDMQGSRVLHGRCACPVAVTRRQFNYVFPLLPLLRYSAVV